MRGAAVGTAAPQSGRGGGLCRSAAFRWGMGLCGCQAVPADAARWDCGCHRELFPAEGEETLTRRRRGVEEDAEPRPRTSVAKWGRKLAERRRRRIKMGK